MKKLLLSQGIWSNEVPTGNLLWVDAVNGNDSLAVRGRLTVPFKTLTAAKTAAAPGSSIAPGDTTIVMPGTYNEKNLLKDYVNWHFLPGAVVNYTGSQNGGIFDTGSNGTNAAVNSLITGYGEFTYAGTGATDRNVINFTAGNLVVRARKFVAGDACVRCGAPSAAPAHVLKIEVLESMLSANDVVSVEGTSEENYLRAHTLLTSGGNAIQVTAGGAVLEAHRLQSTGDIAVYISASGSGTTILKATEIYSSVNNAISYAYPSTAILKIFGARIKSDGTGTAGGAIDISTTASDKIRLFGCILVAAGDKSVFASSASTQVHATSGIGLNKSAHTNVTWLGPTPTINANID